MPLVVLGAACGGSSPVGPSNPIAADEGFATAPDASATAKDVANCRTITGVNVTVLPSTHDAIVVEATYENFGSPIRCHAPVWTSNPRGVLTPQLGGFRVGVSSNREVVVTAPNGVKGRLFIPGPMDVSTSAVCAGVDGVNLSVVPSMNHQNTLVRATYLNMGGPSLDRCGAPAWTSNPRGVFTPTMDAFTVGLSTVRPVTVTATAPNGRSAQITLTH